MPTKSNEPNEPISKTHHPLGLRTQMTIGQNLYIYMVIHGNQNIKNDLVNSKSSIFRPISSCKWPDQPSSVMSWLAEKSARNHSIDFPSWKHTQTSSNFHIFRRFPSFPHIFPQFVHHFLMETSMQCGHFPRNWWPRHPDLATPCNAWVSVPARPRQAGQARHGKLRGALWRPGISLGNRILQQ